MSTWDIFKLWFIKEMMPLIMVVGLLFFVFLFAWIYDLIKSWLKNIIGKLQ